MSFDFRKANVGDSDRAIRALLGFGLILVGFIDHSRTLGVIGVLLLLTAYLRTCPVYTLIDFKTDKGEAPAGK